LGNLSTPKTVQKLQKALHAKAKAEAGYRFYALYDKISRDDILAQPRHSVVRQPPGANFLDLIPTQPMDLMVRAKRLALPVVAGELSKAKRATVLVDITLPGSARSSARFQGSFSPSDSSALIRCNLASSDMDASCSRSLVAGPSRVLCKSNCVKSVNERLIVAGCP
jgi:hypothetical protein